MAHDCNATLIVWERTLLFYDPLRGDEADDGRDNGKGSKNVFHTECLRPRSSTYVSRDFTGELPRSDRVR